MGQFSPCFDKINLCPMRGRGFLLYRMFLVTTTSTPVPQTSEITITFPVPDEMKGEESIRVTFLQDGVMVGVPAACSGNDESVSCTFSGTRGTRATVYAAFNGKPYGEQEIIF